MFSTNDWNLGYPQHFNCRCAIGTSPSKIVVDLITERLIKKLVAEAIIYVSMNS